LAPAGFSQACLTTDRAEANRDSSPISAEMTGADRQQTVDAVDKLPQAQLTKHGGRPSLSIGQPCPPVTHRQVHEFQRAAALRGHPHRGQPRRGLQRPGRHAQRRWARACQQVADLLYAREHIGHQREPPRP
jgi:hypothetical protein